jgi:peptidylprolyl isomerase
MANNGPTTNSSQFLLHVATPWLEGAKHTIFGQIVEKGMDVVNTIVQNDYINKVTIIRNGSCQKIQCSKTFTDYFAE